jgi:hypothetical protein
LWWFVPVVIVWRGRDFLSSRALRCLGALLTVSFGFLAFLFLFTDAAQWAESYTAINRLVMHLVPAVVTLLALLLRDVPLYPEPIHTAQSSSPRSSPA